MCFVHQFGIEWFASGCSTKKVCPFICPETEGKTRSFPRKSLRKTCGFHRTDGDFTRSKPQSWPGFPFLSFFSQKFNYFVKKIIFFDLRSVFPFILPKFWRFRKLWMGQTLKSSGGWWSTGIWSIPGPTTLLTVGRETSVFYATGIENLLQRISNPGILLNDIWTTATLSSSIDSLPSTKSALWRTKWRLCPSGHSGFILFYLSLKMQKVNR